MLYGHKIAKEMEAWWERNGGNADSSEWKTMLADYKSLLDVKMDEMTSEHINAGEDGESRFGMSKAAGCTRAAALKYLGYEGEPFSGSTRFTFALGHFIEVLALSTLRACGYSVGDAQAPVRIDPFMHSMSDGIMTIAGKPCILSVKSSAYKMSSRQRGKWLRRGFTELPFEGVRKAQPSWWAQAQAEMHGSGIHQALILAVSKDIVKVFEDDPYMGKEGNGSLTFFAQLIRYDPAFCRDHLVPVWTLAWDAVQNRRAGPAYFLNNVRDEYVELEKASSHWEPNATRTGTFAPCLYCTFTKECKAVS